MIDPLHDDLNDELLSAYLDDELSADERAAVETRLAEDPAARRLLDELRSASQAIRTLPKEALGRQMSESILRQIEAVKAKSAAPAADGGAMPKITLFRTARGWVWASMAVAAALLIMMLQSEPEAERDRPVALRHREPPMLTAAPDAAPPAVAESRARMLSEEAVAEAAPAGPAPRAGGELGTADRFAMDRAEPTHDASAPPSAIALRGAPAREGSTSEALEEPLVVVNVVAKREAIQNRSFDRLLESKGIAVEPAASDTRHPTPVTQPSDQPAEAIADSLDRADGADHVDDAAPLDVVLVEAPATTIVSFLAALNSDVENYVAVAVDDAADGAQRLNFNALDANARVVELHQFNRGAVPQQQKEAFARNKAYFYSQVKDGSQIGARLDERRDVARGFQQQTADAFDARGGFPSQGRAQRVEIPFAKQRPAGEKLGALQQQKSPPPADDDTLQVMFVLTCNGETAPAAAAEHPPH